MAKNNALPLIIMGGAAAFLLSKKKKSGDSNMYFSGDEIHGGGAIPGAMPTPSPSQGESGEDEMSSPMAEGGSSMSFIDIERLLADLGFPPGNIDGKNDADAKAAIEGFQEFWNSYCEWLWKYDDRVSPSNPQYQKITVDGIWGPKTAGAASRAINVVPSSGAEINGQQVFDFYNAVLALYKP